MANLIGIIGLLLAAPVLATPSARHIHPAQDADLDPGI
jgi:hypothetical protein